MRRIALKIIKPIELIILIITILTAAYEIRTDSIFLIFKPFTNQIIYAIYTAILVTILFNISNRFRKWIRNRKFLGFWIVLKFDSEKYFYGNEFVEITESKDSLSTLEYLEKNCNNLDIKKGIIFMDVYNDKSGELVTAWDWINEIASVYPLNANKIYFDKNTFKLKHPVPIIRILNSSGQEIKIIEKAEDQRKMKIYIDNNFDYKIEIRANSVIEDLFADKNRNSN